MTGHELREMRIAADVSATKMAKLTGWSRKTIYNIEWLRKVPEEKVDFYKKKLALYIDRV